MSNKQNQNQYTYGGQVTNTNLPGYVTPDNQWIYDLIMENYGAGQGIEGILERIRGIEPTPFLERLPFGQEQIGQFIANKLSGKGVSERAEQYTRQQIDALNRMATKEARKYEAGMAATGGRGSSFDAAMRAKGKAAIAAGRGEARQRGMEYEDALRRQAFQQGMGALSAYEGAARGDWEQALQGGQLLLGSLAPELQAYGLDMETLHDLWQMHYSDAMSENEFNLMLYQLLKSGASGSDIMNFLGQATGTVAGLLSIGAI